MESDQDFLGGLPEADELHSLLGEPAPESSAVDPMVDGATGPAAPLPDGGYGEDGYGADDEFLADLPESDELGSLFGTEPAGADDQGLEHIDAELDEYDAEFDLDADLDALDAFDAQGDERASLSDLDELPEASVVSALLSGESVDGMSQDAIRGVLDVLTDSDRLAELIQSLGAKDAAPANAAQEQSPAVTAAATPEATPERSPAGNRSAVPTPVAASRPKVSSSASSPAAPLAPIGPVEIGSMTVDSFLRGMNWQARPDHVLTPPESQGRPKAPGTDAYQSVGSMTVQSFFDACNWRNERGAAQGQEAVSAPAAPPAIQW